jgi:hypothetical protein
MAQGSSRKCRFRAAWAISLRFIFARLMGVKIRLYGKTKVRGYTLA